MIGPKCMKEMEGHLVQKNMEANKCVEIQGQCHKNPCHPNANCYDNFNNDTGAYESTVCR